MVSFAARLLALALSITTAVNAFPTSVSVRDDSDGGASMFNHCCLKPSPANRTRVDLPSSGGISAEASSPNFVIYWDKFIPGLFNPPDPSTLKGYNVFALSFLLLSGPADQAVAWTELDAATRASIKSSYNAAGIKLIVSAFGSSDAPTSVGADPIATANTFAAWVKQWGMDGIDVDYEDFNAFDAADGRAETWLISFTNQLRAQLPHGQYIITHAPVAPWFSPSLWSGGGYLAVEKGAGSAIDWYNVQFYNQGTSEYTTCAGLLTASSTTWPQTALFQIIASGVPANKLVIGKPAGTGDANNGFMSTSLLAQCVQQAKSSGWNAGVMVWQYNDATSAWIAAVRASAFPE